MILRIKKICQFGVFRQFRSGGSVPFADRQNISVVFGRNTLGKTTLASVFQSLGEDNPSLALERVSVPIEPSISKEIELSYRGKKGREQTVRFSGGKWSKSNLIGRIQVFDQDFVHRNVISGQVVTRENREKFTDFILGAAGVTLSKEIEERKKTLREDKGKLLAFRPEWVKKATNDSEVASFISLQVKEESEDLEKEKEARKKRLHRLTKVTEFNKLEVPSVEIEKANIVAIDLIQKLDATLKENYKKISVGAWNTLQDHISKNCQSADPLAWLKDGIVQKKSNSCPFCGQNLRNVKDLIDTYQAVFDIKFEAHEQDVKASISQLKNKLKTALTKSHGDEITKLAQAIKAFNLYVPGLELKIDAINTLIIKAIAAEETYKKALRDWDSAAEILLDTKNLSTHKTVSNSVKSKKLKTSSTTLSAIQNQIEKLANDSVKKITSAKEKVSKLNTAQVAAEKQTLSQDIDLIDTKLARLEQNDDCVVYKTKSGEVNTEQEAIAKLMDKLEIEQSDYVKEYFNRLGYWFKTFGSDPGFKITKSTNRKGDKTVYSLAVTYNNQKIPQDDLRKFFSESDRRNLALSVFMSRIEKNDDKKNTILVFDDPVVSFDDNRISLACREIRLIATDFCQVIVLTHYLSLVKEFVDCGAATTYTEIKKNPDTSYLTNLDPTALTLHPHERDSERISAFIDGVHDADILRLLRPFMERHLHIIYQKQIKTYELEQQGLEVLINNLSAHRVISGGVASKLHGYRESFNSNHHQSVTDENIESIRLEAKSLMEFLYEELPFSSS